MDENRLPAAPDAESLHADKESLHAVAEQPEAGADQSHLLTDMEMVGFLVNGYHLLEPELPGGLNERVAARLDGLDYNPGDAIAEVVPELWQVLGHPALKGALVSLLGEDYEVMGHRHWHCKQPHTGHMSWHQDSTNSRDTRIDRLLGLYYPTDITPEMGPTIIVPGTQFRNAPTDRMATYTNIRGQMPMVVRAGTVAADPLRPLARYRGQPHAGQAPHDQVPLSKDAGQRGADLEPRSRSHERTHRLGRETGRPQERPVFRQPARRRTERPLQGAPDPVEMLEQPAGSGRCA